MGYPNVIAVTSPSRRSGKGTISNLLVREYGYTEFSFALPIKTMFIALLMYAEVPQAIYPRILDGDLKETPVLAGLSLRNFAEGVGTKWGREMHDPEVWVKIGEQKLDKMLAKGHRVVISDGRFWNECNLARERGGEVWSVERPVENGGLAPTLASEGHLKDYPFDVRFYNSCTVADLEDSVREAMKFAAVR